MSHLAPEPEFEQALHEISATLEPFFEKNPSYRRALKVFEIPERVIQFRVTWEDDEGNIQVNRGYRVQFNSALGPYKGGLRLHPSVNLSILKFLGFEQIFKNALTGLMMGGGKGGCDFDPKGKSDNEIRRFCYAFMLELSRHIGADTDVPAGDIGTGGREIGYMFGAYKQIRNEFVGVLTGKGMSWGGSYIRPEATGYGLVYYVEHMLRDLDNTTFSGKRVLISGSGNVAQYAALKVIELGGTVLSLSDSTGSLIATTEEGFHPSDVEAIATVKLNRQPLTAFVETDKSAKSRFQWHEGKRPWTLVDRVDVALPSATQNEVSKEEAEALIKAGTRYIAEGSNMGCTQEAIEVFEASREKATSLQSEGLCWYAPGKAANCGGVAVSGLEMSQNSAREQWDFETLDGKLKAIIENCYKKCADIGREYSINGGLLPSLQTGANIGGFVITADAARAQGQWW